ncbi:hypothetical protein F5882DRAFT_93622 [Hyaloscypha sp. PMI_1271]|nr:hypothetical protein F5882DRAFT_93622 [Hyaloscypha sp. PMI_1271]
MKRDLIGFGTFWLGRRIHIGIPFDLPYSSHLISSRPHPDPHPSCKILHLPAESSASDPSNRQHFRPSQTVSVVARVASSCPPGLCLLANFAPILHSTVMLMNSAVPSLLSPLCLFATVTQTHAPATSRLLLENCGPPAVSFPGRSLPTGIVEFSPRSAWRSTGPVPGVCQSIKIYLSDSALPATMPHKMQLHHQNSNPSCSPLQRVDES